MNREQKVKRAFLGGEGGCVLSMPERISTSSRAHEMCQEAERAVAVN